MVVFLFPSDQNNPVISAKKHVLVLLRMRSARNNNFKQFFVDLTECVGPIGTGIPPLDSSRSDASFKHHFDIVEAF